jgi:23S rRNA (cytosine1962-C5)-methyltransferase
VSEQSKIRVRLLSSNANDKYDDAFFARRLRYAIDCRHSIMGDDFEACRLVFGEADGLPGLTVDRFADVCVTQVLSYGMELRKDALYGALREILSEYGVTLRGIYERNDVAIRELEGLPQSKGWYRPETVRDPATTVTIRENGILYTVDFENGQKTGFFLDQKYNRLAVAKIARGRRVLDCFTHTGSFALNAAMGGAAHVTAVDISQSAVDAARENAERNGLADRMDFLCTDVFDLLPALAERGDKPYDLIILDPPAFTKSRKTVQSAQRGYKEINYRAMKLLPRGGYLATCSCSHFMENELFLKMLESASRDAGVQLRQLEARQQCCDHPILWNVPQTDYLKFYIFQIV